MTATTVGLLFSAYLVLSPAAWLFDIMELTPIPFSFKLFLMAMAAAGFGISAFAETYLLLYLAQIIGTVKVALSSGHKKRKLYKIIDQHMRV